MSGKITRWYADSQRVLSNSSSGTATSALLIASTSRASSFSAGGSGSRYSICTTALI